MLARNIGNIIRNRREALKITQRHLADLADVSINTLYKIERGESNPTLELTERILNVIGLEINILPKQIES